jgi:hypothetical protein
LPKSSDLKKITHNVTTLGFLLLCPLFGSRDVKIDPKKKQLISAQKG